MINSSGRSIPQPGNLAVLSNRLRPSKGIHQINMITNRSGLSGSGSCSDERIQLIRPILHDHLSSPSPLKLARRRRRLAAGTSPARAAAVKKDNCGFAPDTEASPNSSPVAARRLRKLTLFDSPRTPRSIVRHLELRRTPSSTVKPKAAISTPKSSYESPRLPYNDPGITINPFTPANRNNKNKKSRVSIRAAATSRFRSEFIELSRLGQGEFGAVYRVVNRFVISNKNRVKVFKCVHLNSTHIMLIFHFTLSEKKLIIILCVKI